MSQSDEQSEHAAHGSPSSDRLDSWKEIAAFLQRDVRTVQRWEKQAGLPVHRHAESRLRTAYAYRAELDAWWRAQRAAVETAAEESSGLRRWPAGRRIALAAIAGVVALATAIAAILIGIGRTGMQDSGAEPLPISVLLARFEDQAGDPRLVALLEERIGRDLQADRRIEPVAPARVARILRLMRRDPAVRVTDSVAREVAVRDGQIAFAIGGGVHRIDSRIFVDLTVIVPADGRVYLSREWEGTDQEAVLSRATDEIEALVDHLFAASAGPTAPALEQVTTASLPALRLYSAAVDAARRRQWEASELLARRALAADEVFASAYAWAAWSVRQQGRPPTESQPLLERALSLAGDVTDRESYFISGVFHTIAADYPRAVAAFEALFRVQPGSRDVLDLLIDAYMRSGRIKEAADLAVMRAERDPNDFYAAVRAAHALTIVRRDEARGHLFVRRAQQLATTPGARDRPFWSAWLSGLPAYQRWLAGDSSGALEALAALERTLPDRIGRERDAYASTVGFGYLALGRVEQAERAFWQAVAPIRQLNLAMLALTVRGEEDARRWLSQIREHAGARPALFARAGLDREAETGLEHSTAVEHVEGIAAVTRGLIASHRGQIEDARAALRRGFDLLRASGEPEYFFAAEALAGIASARGETDRSLRYLAHVGAARGRTYSASQWTAGYWIRLNRDLADVYRRLGQDEDAARVDGTLRSILGNTEVEPSVLAPRERTSRR